MDFPMVAGDRRLDQGEVAALGLTPVKASVIQQEARRVAMAAKPGGCPELFDFFSRTEWTQACKQLGIPVACLRVNSTCPKPCAACPCDFPEAPAELVEQLKVLRPFTSGGQVTIDGQDFVLVGVDISAGSQRVTIAPADCIELDIITPLPAGMIKVLKQVSSRMCTNGLPV